MGITIKLQNGELWDGKCNLWAYVKNESLDYSFSFIKLIASDCENKWRYNMSPSFLQFGIERLWQPIFFTSKRKLLEYHTKMRATPEYCTSEALRVALIQATIDFRKAQIIEHYEAIKELAKMKKSKGHELIS